MLKKTINCALLGIYLSSCSSTPPTRTFKTTLWQIDYNSKCLSRITDDNVIITICDDSPEFPLVLGISPEDYVKEREFQDALQKSCF